MYCVGDNQNLQVSAQPFSQFFDVIFMLVQFKSWPERAVLSFSVDIEGSMIKVVL